MTPSHPNQNPNEQFFKSLNLLKAMKFMVEPADDDAGDALRVTFANYVAMEAFNHSLEEMTALGTRFLPKMLDEEDMRYFLKRVQEELNGQSINTDNITLTVLHGHGNFKRLLGNISLFNADGNKNAGQVLCEFTVVEGGDRTEKTMAGWCKQQKYASNKHRFENITKTEMERIHMILAGHKRTEIVKMTNTTVETVKSCRKQIYSKLGVKSVMELTTLCRDCGII